jgi:hypothetical protein
MGFHIVTPGHSSKSWRRTEAVQATGTLFVGGIVKRTLRRDCFGCSRPSTSHLMADGDRANNHLDSRERTCLVQMGVVHNDSCTRVAFSNAVHRRQWGRQSTEVRNVVIHQHDKPVLSVGVLLCRWVIVGKSHKQGASRCEERRIIMRDCAYGLRVVAEIAGICTPGIFPFLLNKWANNTHHCNSCP